MDTVEINDLLDSLSFTVDEESMTRVEIGAKQKGRQDCERSLVGRFLSNTEISIFGISSLLCGRREVTEIFWGINWG